jgi:hypothetical protein
MSIIKNYHDKKWTLQFLDALYNSIDWMLLNFYIFKFYKYKLDGAPEEEQWW